MTDNPNIIKEALEIALQLLEPFESADLSLGLGSDALKPIRAALALIEKGEVMYPKYRDTLMDDYSFTKDFITDEPVLVIPLEQSE